MTTMTTTKKNPERPEPRREALLTDFTLSPMSREDKHKAALAVCARSTDAAEARELLDALGLLGEKGLKGAA